MDAKTLIGIALLAGLAAGCTTPPKDRYGDMDDDLPGRKDRLEYTQQHRLVAEMIERMLSDPRFTSFYDAALARANALGYPLPAVIVGKIEDNTEAGSNDYLATSQMRKELEEALGKTGKFIVSDLQERERMKRTAIADVAGGAQRSARITFTDEDGEPVRTELDNIDSIRQYQSGGFTMEGELARDRTDDSYFHFFNLWLIDTRSGLKVWNGSVGLRKD
jgi:PBP1b-binding outer membrane lipoprotein LpoB